MNEPVVAVRDLSMSFAGVKALDSVSMAIPRGEIHCLAGENGSGKSTLIKVISGVYTPSAGTIEFGGQSYTQLAPIDAIRHGVQVIYQDFSVFPNLTVMENLALTSEVAARRKLVSWSRFRKIAEDAVAKINFTVDLDATVGDLPVADKQLVAISRALMSDAKLIIMDEPTTALTTKEVDALFRIILDLQTRGISTLFVSHKLGEVFEISERFTILRNGKVVVTAFTEDLNRQSFAKYMTGREFTDVRFESTVISDEPVMEVENLCLDGAFDDVSFSISKGEILGVTGLLGSGRTELALTLCGMFPASGGQISVNGKPVRLSGMRDAIKNRIGYVPEDRLTEGLMLSRSIGENIVISEINSMTTAMGTVDRKKVSAEIAKWVGDLKIATPNPANAVSTLSGGNQQRVVLAKWLATNPEILILNGPTVGVDIGSKRDIHQILHELARSGIAIIIISDDIPEVLENCNRILMMKSGRIDAEVDPNSTTEAQLTAMISSQDSAEAVA